MQKQKNTYVKKSSVDLTELAIGIVILGICVSIGAVILNKFGASQITSTGTYQIANESVTSVNQIGDTLANVWVKNIDYAANASNNALISSGNYSLSVNADTGTGTIYCTTGQAAINNSNWKVTYTVYNTSDVRYALSNNASIGLSEYGNWFKILVIVGIAAVVLGLIFLAFGNKDRGMGASY